VKTTAFEGTFSMNPIMRVCQNRYGANAGTTFDTACILWSAGWLLENGLTQEDVQLALREINKIRGFEMVPPVIPSQVPGLFK
jgi:hypothetical protein